jgi:hypothetical protein
MSVHGSIETEESREVIMVVIVTATYLSKEMFSLFGENRRKNDGSNERFLSVSVQQKTEDKGAGFSRAAESSDR